jgi:hypothetical protein
MPGPVCPDLYTQPQSSRARPPFRTVPLAPFDSPWGIVAGSLESTARAIQGDARSGPFRQPESLGLFCLVREVRLGWFDRFLDVGRFLGCHRVTATGGSCRTGRCLGLPRPCSLCFPLCQKVNSMPNPTQGPASVPIGSPQRPFLPIPLVLRRVVVGTVTWAGLAFLISVLIAGDLPSIAGRLGEWALVAVAIGLGSYLLQAVLPIDS